jgi:hypothetical protein
MNVTVFENGVPKKYSGIQLGQILEQIEGICNHTPELPYKFRACVDKDRCISVECIEGQIPDEYFNLKVRVARPFQRIDLFGTYIRIAPTGTWPFDMRVQFTRKTDEES